MRRIRLKNDKVGELISGSHISQSAWARRLGISRSYLSQLLKGQKLYPSEAVRNRLLDVFEVPYETLFEVEGESSEPGTRVILIDLRLSRFEIRVLRRRNGTKREGISLMRGALLDLRYGFRSMARAPVLSAIIVLTLTIGIGMAATIFSIVDQALFRAPPGLGNPEGLLLLYRGGADQPSGAISYPDYRDIRKRSSSLDDLVATFDTTVNIGTEQGTERALARLVTTNYFELLQAQIPLGRAFSETEDGRVAVLSHGLWSRWFGARSDIVGGVVILNRQAYTVIGVAAPQFRGTTGLENAPQLWVPVEQIGDFLPSMGSQPLRERHWSMFRLVARRSRQALDGSIQRELEALSLQLEEEDPSAREARRFQFRAVKGSSGDLALDLAGTYAAILSGAIAFLLLITCGNVVNLILGRGLTRRSEMALRQALGASRLRLARLLFVESSILFSFGGVAGTILALGLLTLISRRVEEMGAVGVDFRVLLSACAVTFLAGAISSILPAFQAWRGSAVESLRIGMGGLLPSSTRLKSTLVVGQVALSVVLLVAAGLLVRTMLNLSSVDPGFQTKNILTAKMDLDLLGYDQNQGWNFFRDLLEEVRTLPGVEAASITNDLPLGPAGSRMGVYIEGSSPQPLNIPQSLISPGYFKSMGIPLVEGREFGEHDAFGAPGVTIVNESLARSIWPNQRAVGKRLGVAGPRGPFYEVVGVVGDHRQRSLREPAEPHLFWSHRQVYRMMSGSEKTLVIRTANEPTTHVGPLRDIVQRLEPDLPIYEVRTLSQQIALSWQNERRLTVVLIGFAGSAILLSMVGLYGIVSYSVHHRRREIGIRSVLGAGRGELMKMILEQGARLTALGLMLGALISLGVDRTLSNLLYAVGPNDPVTYAVIAFLVVFVGLAACWLPARQASRTNPMDAVRYE